MTDDTTDSTDATTTDTTPVDVNALTLSQLMDRPHTRAEARERERLVGMSPSEVAAVDRYRAARPAAAIRECSPGQRQQWDWSLRQLERLAFGTAPFRAYLARERRAVRGQRGAIPR